jgi:hypothetical protein
MIHKHISLPEDLNHHIKQRAALLQEPEEAVIRDLLSIGLKSSRISWGNSGEALRTLSQLGIQGPADLAKKHDDDYRASQP